MNVRKQSRYVFYVDGKEVVTDQLSLNGQEIKALAGVPGDYQLFVEVEGDRPDQLISDGNAVDLSGRATKHFYAVPPATFGI